MTNRFLVGAAAAALSLAVAGGAYASGINTTRSNIKNSANAQSSGDNSPVTVTQEATSNSTIVDNSREETGILTIADSPVGLLANTVLSATVTGNWTGDEDPGDAMDKQKELLITTGEIGGSYGAPGITNVQQNTGGLSAVQGAVAMPVSVQLPN